MDKTWAVKAILMAGEVLCHIYTHFLGIFLGIVAAMKSALTVSVFLVLLFFNHQYSIKMVCFVLVFFSGPRVRLLLCLMRLLNFIHSRGRVLSLPDYC